MADNKFIMFGIDDEVKNLHFFQYHQDIINFRGELKWEKMTSL
jgi:hypothetical protein